MEAILDFLNKQISRLSWLNDQMYLYVLVGLLIAVGLVLTILTRGVQFRRFGEMIRYSFGSRRGADGGISSFQAFAIGMATRIGIGNITGVAIALILGGPGAIFWMWIVALVGMATSFAEASLAQLFKVRWNDGTFRGGPAYYLQYALRSRKWGVLFAVLLIFSMVIAMPMVQANTIAVVFESNHGVDTWVSAVILMVLTALVVFGGVRLVAKAAEIMTPFMAVGYIIIALIVVFMNIGNVPEFLSAIVTQAFGVQPAVGGIAGGVVAALLNGARRGLFSNEAGMGTNPNAAATATVRHPAQQGLIQSLGVFVDTMFVCTSTAFIILATGPEIYIPGVTTIEQAGDLTTRAVTSQLGNWMSMPMSIMIFFFGFSSILGAYAYAEVNSDFLRGKPGKSYLMAVLAVITTGIGSVLALPTVWILMDSAMALITILNLIGLLVLSRWVVGMLQDYDLQRKAGEPDPSFNSHNNPNLPANLDSEVWRR